MLGLKISPETIIVLTFALIVDGSGIALVLVGADDFGITDTIGLVFLGTWLKLRKGLSVKIDRKDFKRGIKFLGSALCEYIPYLGALPFWTITVLSTLKESNEEQLSNQEEPEIETYDPTRESSAKSSPQ